MGSRGPVGKRSDQKVRRNKTGEDGLETDTIPMIGTVEAPKLDLGLRPHPLVQSLWDSLPESGQTRYWEPSDWQYARVAMYALDELLTKSPKGISAMKLTAVDGMLKSLLLTEGERRRVKIEVERNQAEAKVFDMTDHLMAALDQAAANQ